MSCIGATPAGPPDLAMRPSEIYTWLKSWNEMATSVDKVTSYVAVDDRDLATEMGGDKLMRGRMILTQYEDGSPTRSRGGWPRSSSRATRNRGATAPRRSRSSRAASRRRSAGRRGGQGRRRRRPNRRHRPSPGHAHQRGGGGRRADADPLGRRRLDPPRAAAPAAPRAAPVVRAAGRARDLRRPHAAAPVKLAPLSAEARRATRTSTMPLMPSPRDGATRLSDSLPVPRSQP